MGPPLLSTAERGVLGGKTRPRTAASSRGIPDWVADPERVGFERWTPTGWANALPATFPEEHARLVSHFVSQIRNPFRLDGNASLFFGRDDLALSTLRPRHGGLDIGGRIRLARENQIVTLPAATHVYPLAAGGYVVGGKNLQKVLYLLREGRRRFRLIVELEYEHVQFAGKARGTIRVFSTADQSLFLKWPCAASQAIHRDGRIVGYEALGWVRTPAGALGILEPGRFQTQDPVLAARRIPKGSHLHLNLRGIHDDDPAHKAHLLNNAIQLRLAAAHPSGK